MHTVNLIKCPLKIVEKLFPNKQPFSINCYITFSSPDIIVFNFQNIKDQIVYPFMDYPLIRKDLPTSLKPFFDVVATNSAHEAKAANMCLEFLASTMD